MGLSIKRLSNVGVLAGFFLVPEIAEGDDEAQDNSADGDGDEESHVVDTTVHEI